MVPPGDWRFVVELELGEDLYATSRSDEVTVWSVALPLTVTAVR